LEQVPGPTDLFTLTEERNTTNETDRPVMVAHMLCIA